MTQTLIEKLKLLHKKLIAEELGYAALMLNDIMESSNKEMQEPLGYVDEFGNFENSLKQWMIEEPNVTWSPVFTHPQLSDETVKDAERYRWLMENSDWFDEHYVAHIDIDKPETISMAIDEAMKAEHVPE